MNETNGYGNDQEVKAAAVLRGAMGSGHPHGHPIFVLPSVRGDGLTENGEQSEKSDGYPL